MPLLRCPVQVGGCALATNAQPPPPLEWRLNDGSRRHRNVIVLPIGWVAHWSGGSDLAAAPLSTVVRDMPAPQPLVKMS